MVKTRLLLANEQMSPPLYLDNCPQYEEQSINTTYQISDIRNPEYSEVTKTATFKIPGTQEVNVFFENVYDVNISLQTFNPNLKVKAYYYQDELLALEGYLQIIDIDVDEVTKDLVYNCNVLGQVGSFQSKIKDLQLNELDFSAYDHALTYANIVASWTATAGTGYAYPLEDSGVNNSDFYNGVKPEHFRPVLYKREILEKIFTAQGYTWTSTFLDGAEFKKKVQPMSNLPVLNATALNNNKFLAVNSGGQVFTLGMTAPGGQSMTYGSSTYTTLQYPNETYDVGNIYNNVSYQFTPAVTNKYNVNVYQALNFLLHDGSNSDVGSLVVSNGGTSITVSIINANTQVVLGSTIFGNNQNINFAASNANYVNVLVPNVDLVAGVPYYVRIQFGVIQLFGNSNFTNTPYTLYVTNTANSNYSAEFTSNAIYEGATIELNETLPTDYKQSDFISDLRKEYFLQFLEDKQNPNNIIIEPWVDFYLGTSKDFTLKHDIGSGVKVIPMGELDFNRLICKHAEDGDYYNKLHFDEYKETYGTYTKQIENDFIKGDRIIQPNIAATPYALNNATGLVLPTTYKKENGITSPMKTKVRSWHWSGLINLPLGISWTFVYNNGSNSVTYNTLPQAGHTDNPWSPTLDMCFDEPNKVYFNYPNLQWTDNNLYNRFYSQYINEVTDKNSKIIRTKFHLTPYDIYSFDFRYPVFCIINGEQGYYIVNKIEEYNPLTQDSTMMELLKLTEYAIFTPSEAVYSGDGGGNGLPNYYNNTNYSPSSEIIGGNGNFIPPAVESFVLINSENYVATTDDSNTTRIGGSQQAMTPNVLRVTSDFSVDGIYQIYEIDLDTIGVDITATWDAVAYPYQVTFKIVSNTSDLDFIIDDMTSPPSSPPQTIDGNALPFTTNLITYDALTIYSNGTNLYTI